MVFVTIIPPFNKAGFDRILAEKLETACKKAWSSMGGLSADVGGATGNIFGAGIYPFDTLRVIFQYNRARNEEFEDRLRQNLYQEIFAVLKEQGLSWGVDVALMPANAWFKNPVWSRIPCDKSHIIEDDGR